MLIKFAQAISRYVQAPSFESSVELYRNLGLVGDDRIDKYRAAVQHVQKSLVTRKSLILFGLQAGRINQEITTIGEVIPAGDFAANRKIMPSRCCETFQVF